jgi:hypothetical protein
MDNGIFTLDNEKLKTFCGNLREKDDNELRSIVTRYINYLPEMAEAALIISVDRGFISYNVKEKVSGQIMTNFEAHQRGIKPTGWETDNAFREYVSRYSDDELYFYIDQPSDMVIDVYNAILDVARDRELITETNRTTFATDAKLAARSEDEILMSDYREFTKDIVGEDTDDLTEEQIEEEKQKYWVCPKCHEMVEMEMGTCWNCQTESPEIIVHPDAEVIVREHEIRKPFSFTRAGISMISLAAILIIIGLIDRSQHWRFFKFDGYGEIVLGGIALLLGLFFLIQGARKVD